MRHCWNDRGILLVAILMILVQAPSAAAEGVDRLVENESLAGWEGDRSMFRLEKGAIVAGTLENEIPHNYFLCTKKEYGDFELRLKAKLIGEGKNAGVQFRSRRIPDHHELVGYQCDMGETGERLIWGSLYDESRRRTFLAHGDADRLRKAFQPGDWNELRIRARGERIQIWVNGYQTVDYTEQDDSIARRGVIALQIHGGPPAEAWYKEIQIRQLD